jgi:aquaporin related protein
MALVEDIYAALFEFVGTTLFLLLGLGGIQAISSPEFFIPDGSSNVVQLLYISMSMGFSLLATVWLFFRVTGGVFNPNISLALLMVGAISPVRFVLYSIAQLLGGVVASGLLLALLPGELASNTALGPRVNAAQGVFIEMFLTAALVLSVLLLAAEKHAATPFAPVGIGLTLFVCHLFGVYYTGASMNTARSFGPAAVTGFKDSHHWVYWVGPYLGSLLATGFFIILKRVPYTVLAAGQDSSDSEKSPRLWIRASQTALNPSVGDMSDVEAHPPSSIPASK